MNDINLLIIPAARKGEIEVLNELIHRNADLNFQDEKGYTPLIIACYNNQPEAAKLLIEHGANIDAAD
ncbi:MAG: ankyrin repeat domain-containing protein, partial [Chryseobacterium sp.]